MKLQEIAMFKTFLEKRGIDKLFVGAYKNRKRNENPTKVESYLQRAEQNQVMMKAFYFVVNSERGYDYWYDLQMEFNDYVMDNADKFPMDEIKSFKGSGRILRKDWDALYIWREQNKIDTANRYGVELPNDEKAAVIFEHIRQGCASQAEKELYKTLVPQHIDAAEIEEDTPSVPESDNNEDDFLGSLESINIIQSRKNRLADGEVSINIRDGAKITFNQIQSKQLLKYQHLCHVSLAKGKQGQIYIVFSEKQGDATALYYEDRISVQVNSTSLVRTLHTLLNLKEKYSIAKIKCASTKLSYVAFEISK